MEHPDAPEGKALKYAQAERERRFLVAQVPEGPCVRRAEITDLYVTGTRLRLRQVVETTTWVSAVSRKFTQKIPAPGGGPGLVTTTYLDEAEYTTLGALGGARLTKTRYTVPPIGVDVFTGDLAGLVLVEVEAQSAQDEEDFRIPAEAIAEVTIDPRLSGGRLALANRPELVSLLAGFGLEPLDTSELAGRALTDLSGRRRSG